MPTIAKTRRAFTLVELLVVISMISLLVAILVPSIGAARELARRSACMTNQKLIGNGIVMYITDNKQYVPPVFTLAKDSAGRTDMLGYFLADILQPYTDPEGKRLDKNSTFASDSWSIGCQPADGNLDKKMPLLRFSRRWDCPGVKNNDEFEFAVNVNDKFPAPKLWPWVMYYTGTPSKPTALPDWVKPILGDSTWTDAGDWRNNAHAYPRQIAWFNNPSNSCELLDIGMPIKDDPRTPKYLFSFSVSGTAQAFADAAPHLKTLNGLMMDGHVENYTAQYIMSQNNQDTLPFCNKP